MTTGTESSDRPEPDERITFAASDGIPINASVYYPPPDQEKTVDLRPVWRGSGPGGLLGSLVPLFVEGGLLQPAGLGQWRAVPWGDERGCGRGEIEAGFEKVLNVLVERWRDPAVGARQAFAGYLEWVREGAPVRPAAGADPPEAVTVIDQVELAAGLLELAGLRLGSPWDYEGMHRFGGFNEDIGCPGCDSGPETPAVVGPAQCRARGSSQLIALEDRMATRTVLWPLMRDTIGAWSRRGQRRWWQQHLDRVEQLHRDAYPHLAAGSPCLGAARAHRLMAERRRHGLAWTAVRYANIPRRDLLRPGLRRFLDVVAARP